MSRIKIILIAFSFVLIISFASILAATPHLISLQGYVTNNLDSPISSGNVTVRIYDASTGGNLIYNSGTDYNSAISNGIFDVLLGSITPLSLDNTMKYYMEVDINGQEVVGDATTGRREFYPGGGNHTHTYSSLDAADGSPTNAVYVDNGGSVGIGSTNPSGSKLFVNSDQGIGVRIDAKSGSPSAATTGLMVYNENSNASDTIAGFSDGYAWDMIIKRTGNVGIGTYSPGTPLEVYREQNNYNPLIKAHNPSAGSSAQATLRTESDVYNIDFGVRSSGWPEAFAFMWSNSNIPIVFATNGAEKMRILANGNVGIGTSSPTAKLDVAGNLNVNGNINLQSSSNTLNFAGSSGYSFIDEGYGMQLHGGTMHPVQILGTALLVGYDATGATTYGQNNLLVSGSVGIGTTNPAYKLDVEGYAQAQGYYTGDIIFQKDNQKLWRMFEDEDGLYLESLKTGKIYRFILQEVEK
jgi:hypothetical protein